MQENRGSSPIKTKILRGSLTAAVAIGWLLFQIWLFGNQQQYFSVSETICKFLGIKSNEEWRRGASIMAYLTTITPILYGYFLTVQRPRLFPAEGYWNKRRVITSASVLSLVTLLHLLSAKALYRALFPLSGVQGSFSGCMYDVVFLLNFIVAVAGLLLVLGGAYIPSILRHRREIFRGSRMAKSAGRYGLCVAMGILIVIGGGLMLNIAQAFTDEKLVRHLATSKDENLITGVATMLIMAPLVEELAFRGLIFGRLKKDVPVWAAALFSAVCFGLWHRNLPQFCYTLPAGIWLAFVYHQTGRLRYAMVVHGVCNVLEIWAFAVRAKYFPYFPALYRFGQKLFSLSAPVSGVLFAAVIAALVLTVWKLFPLLSEKDDRCLSTDGEPSPLHENEFYEQGEI